MTEIRDNDIYTGREVKRMLRKILEGEDEVVVSTIEASRLLGHSPDWWRRRAPLIPGAYQPKEDGPWVLPLGACRAQLAELRRDGKLRERLNGRAKKPFGRGPRKSGSKLEVVS